MRKPAEAEKYKLERLAEAERLRIVLEAEADAEALAVKGRELVTFFKSKDRCPVACHIIQIT